MFLLKLITILGLTITFTETPEIDCNYLMTNGCYLPNQKIIYLNYQSDDINRTLYHELGHAIFWNNKQAENTIKYYPPLTQESRKLYTKYILDYQEYPNIVYQEMVADYFAEFILNNKEFSVKYPCLFIFFRNKLNKIIK